VAVTAPFPHGGPVHSDDDVRTMVSGDDAPHVARFAVEVDGRVVGEVQYRHGLPIFPPGVFGLGVVVWDVADRGNGYGREAQRDLVNVLFREHGARRVQAETNPRNHAERRCLEGLGFTPEGTMRAYFAGEDGLGDLVMYFAAFQRGLTVAEMLRALLDREFPDRGETAP
jgi:RimJ/RimL family protein N-acetyltransferase